jgi:hypothetical protein
MLAQMLGVRRTTVTLIAGRLEAAGVLDGRRGYVQIVSREELERHSCECYGQMRDYVAGLFRVSVRSGRRLQPKALAASRLPSVTLPRADQPVSADYADVSTELRHAVPR